MKRNVLNEILLSEETKILEDRGDIAIKYMAIPLVISFNSIDWIYSPENAFDFLLFRFLVIPYTLLILLLKKSKLINHHTYLHSFTLYLGVYTSVLISFTGYEMSDYYSGLNLVVIGSLCFLPWNMRHLAISVLTIYVPYFCALLFNISRMELSRLVVNMAFILSTIFLSVITWFITRQLRTKELRTRMDLEELNLNKDKIIARKTQENTYLHKLSRQFSDQTIEMIQNGLINVESRQRREVTCIFLDIEESTQKANILDFEEYIELLDKFFKICTEILKSNNVTVGTYLGDGFIAFANAPNDVLDHKQQVLKSCSQILKKREVFNKHFKEAWQSEFNIRISVNTGMVHAGFFPSGAQGNYSINGPAANLTSRLCDIAETNTICVSQQFLEGLILAKAGLVVTKNKRELHLKGFSSSQFQVFSLLPCKEDQMSLIKSNENCPLCGAITAIVDDFSELHLVKCTKCNYTDLIETDKEHENAS